MTTIEGRPVSIISSEGDAEDLEGSYGFTDSNPSARDSMRSTKSLSIFIDPDASLTMARSEELTYNIYDQIGYETYPNVKKRTKKKALADSRNSRSEEDNGSERKLHQDVSTENLQTVLSTKRGSLHIMGATSTSNVDVVQPSTDHQETKLTVQDNQQHIQSKEIKQTEIDTSTKSGGFSDKMAPSEVMREKIVSEEINMSSSTRTFSGTSDKPSSEIMKATDNLTNETRVSKSAMDSSADFDSTDKASSARAAFDQHAPRYQKPSSQPSLSRLDGVMLVGGGSQPEVSSSAPASLAIARRHFMGTARGQSVDSDDSARSNTSTLRRASEDVRSGSSTPSHVQEVIKEGTVSRLTKDLFKDVALTGGSMASSPSGTSISSLERRNKPFASQESVDDTDAVKGITYVFQEDGIDHVVEYKPESYNSNDLKAESAAVKPGDKLETGDSGQVTSKTNNDGAVLSKTSVLNPELVAELKEKSAIMSTRIAQRQSTTDANEDVHQTMTSPAADYVPLDSKIISDRQSGNQITLPLQTQLSVSTDEESTDSRGLQSTRSIAVKDDIDASSKQKSNETIILSSNIQTLDSGVTTTSLGGNYTMLHVATPTDSDTGTLHTSDEFHNGSSKDISLHDVNAAVPKAKQDGVQIPMREVIVIDDEDIGSDETTPVVSRRSSGLDESFVIVQNSSAEMDTELMKTSPDYLSIVSTVNGKQRHDRGNDPRLGEVPEYTTLTTSRHKPADAQHSSSLQSSFASRNSEGYARDSSDERDTIRAGRKVVQNGREKSKRTHQALSVDVVPPYGTSSSDNTPSDRYQSLTWNSRPVVERRDSESTITGDSDHHYEGRHMKATGREKIKRERSLDDDLHVRGDQLNMAPPILYESHVRRDSARSGSSRDESHLYQGRVRTMNSREKIQRRESDLESDIGDIRHPAYTMRVNNLSLAQNDGYELPPEYHQLGKGSGPPPPRTQVIYSNDEDTSRRGFSLGPVDMHHRPAERPNDRVTANIYSNERDIQPPSRRRMPSGEALESSSVQARIIINNQQPVRVHHGDDPQRSRIITHRSHSGSRQERDFSSHPIDIEFENTSRQAYRKQHVSRISMNSDTDDISIYSEQETSPRSPPRRSRSAQPPRVTPVAVNINYPIDRKPSVEGLISVNNRSQVQSSTLRMNSMDRATPVEGLIHYRSPRSTPVSSTLRLNNMDRATPVEGIIHYRSSRETPVPSLSRQTPVRIDVPLQSMQSQVEGIIHYAPPDVDPTPMYPVSARMTPIGIPNNPYQMPTQVNQMNYMYPPDVEFNGMPTTYYPAPDYGYDGNMVDSMIDIMPPDELDVSGIDPELRAAQKTGNSYHITMNVKPALLNRGPSRMRTPSRASHAPTMRSNSMASLYHEGSVFSDDGGGPYISSLNVFNPDSFDLPPPLPQPVMMIAPHPDMMYRPESDVGFNLELVNNHPGHLSRTQSVQSMAASENRFVIKQIDRTITAPSRSGNPRFILGPVTPTPPRQTDEYIENYTRGIEHFTKDLFNTTTRVEYDENANVPQEHNRNLFNGGSKQELYTGDRQIQEKPPIKQKKIVSSQIRTDEAPPRKKYFDDLDGPSYQDIRNSKPPSDGSRQERDRKSHSSFSSTTQFEVRHSGDELERISNSYHTPVDDRGSDFGRMNGKSSSRIDDVVLSPERCSDYSPLQYTRREHEVSDHGSHRSPSNHDIYRPVDDHDSYRPVDDQDSYRPINDPDSYKQVSDQSSYRHESDQGSYRPSVHSNISPLPRRSLDHDLSEHESYTRKQMTYLDSRDGSVLRGDGRDSDADKLTKLSQEINSYYSNAYPGDELDGDAVRMDEIVYQSRLNGALLGDVDEYGKSLDRKMNDKVNQVSEYMRTTSLQTERPRQQTDPRIPFDDDDFNTEVYVNRDYNPYDHKREKQADIEQRRVMSPTKRSPDHAPITNLTKLDIRTLYMGAPSHSIKQTLAVERLEDELLDSLPPGYPIPPSSPYQDRGPYQDDGSPLDEGYVKVDEKVDMDVKDGKALLITKVKSAKVVPILGTDEMFKKTSVIVTRRIEINLMVTPQRKSLYELIVKRQKSDDGRGGQRERGSHNLLRGLTESESEELYRVFLGLAELDKAVSC